MTRTLPQTQAEPLDDGTAAPEAAAGNGPEASSPSLVASILHLGTARGIAFAISVVSAPILGRLFAPHAYGALGVLGTMLSILAAFGSLSYVSAIPLAATAAERRGLFVLCSFIGVATTVITGAGVILGAGLLADAFHEPDLAKYAIFFPLMFVADRIRQLLDTTLTCQRRFGAVAVRNVLEIVVTRIAQFGSCLVGLLGSPAGLIVGALAGGYVSAIAAGPGSVRDILHAPNERFRLADLWAATLKHWKFPLILLWSQTINAVTFGLPALILGLRYSVDIVGLYGMAYTMVNLPIQLFASASSQVFYVEAGDRVARGESAAPAAEQLVRVVGVLTAFPLIVVLALGPLLFEVFLGSRWHESGVYAQILMPWMAMMAFAGPLSTMYQVLGRQGEGFVWNIVLLVARFSALYFGGMFFSVRTTMGIFAGVSTVLVAWLTFRPLYLSGVSRRWAAMAIAREYVEPVVLLAPAALLYWCFEAKIAALLALTAACGAYAMILHFRYPHIVEALVARLFRGRVPSAGTL